MGAHPSQPPAELSEEDIKFIATKAKIDHESVKIWYEKLKVSFIIDRSIMIRIILDHRRHVLMERYRNQIQ